MPATQVSRRRTSRRLWSTSKQHGLRLGRTLVAWIGATALVGAGELKPPATIPDWRWLRIETPDEDLNEGARLAVKALWDGAAPKAGVLVPTVCGTGAAYPYWIHPYDNYWINRVSAYLFEAESTEWPIRLFAAYHIPPVRAEDQPQNPPGVYCNGGCGWGRGIMPSVTLACFAEGRVEQAVGYLKAQAAAARKAGSFHEYWTWEKYAGKTEPGGAKWYGETSAGYLDALLHGLLGLRAGEPGFRTAILEPQFPPSWERAAFSLCLPNRSRLDVTYRSGADGTTLEVKTSGAGGELPVTIVLAWRGDGAPRIESRAVTAPRLDTAGGVRRVCVETRGAGWLTLRPSQ